jgi:hypothetical protein
VCKRLKPFILVGGTVKDRGELELPPLQQLMGFIDVMMPDEVSPDIARASLGLDKPSEILVILPAPSNGEVIVLGNRFHGSWYGSFS